MTLTTSQAATVHRAAKILEKLVGTGDVLSSPQHVRDLLKYRIGAREHEVFTVIFLDNRHRVLAIEDMFTGTIDTAAVYPREIIKAALRHNAAALILAHNHPSFVAEPSDTDVRLTRKLIDACALVDVRILDHLIVAGPSCTSLAERGLM